MRAQNSAAGSRTRRGPSGRAEESGRTIVGFDLTEVAPGPDGDEWDANVGARLLYKMIGFALKSQRGA